jgi:hypothetical protein
MSLSSQPSAGPPSQSGSASDGGQSRPEPLTDSQITALSSGGVAAEPALPLPAQVGAGAVTGTWQNDKRINALWGINQNRNSWVGVTGIGWRKLANNSDSAIVALTIIAANAKQMQTSVNYREEADGMIHEMYVW